MRRIGLWFASTAVILALLFGYHTSTSGVLAASSQQAPIVSGSAAGKANAQGSGPSTTSHSAKGTPASKKPAPTKTVKGSVAQTRYGPVQVALTVKGGSITQVSVLQYPNAGGTDQQINSYALPILVDQTVKGQGANVQMVSGATYTSEGYLTSLQSALDQAGL
jgi:uncharacterized protein with FMN-binding domain